MSTTQTVELLPHGPHSMAYTRELGRMLSETVRVLNYATGLGNGEAGLEYPIAVYELVGSLRGAVGGLDQVFRQTGRRMDDLLDAEVLAVSSGRDAGRPDLAVHRFGIAMEKACAAAGQMLRALDDAHAAVSPIGTSEA